VRARRQVSAQPSPATCTARLAHRPLVDRAVDRSVRPKDLLWHRRRVRPVACAATNPRPRFRPARRLSAQNEPAPLIATSEARRVIGRRMPSLIG
jgi:hypothetical protein